MPVIQISKIQHRRGLSAELPSALAEGELGLTLDQGTVFIGAPNFAPISTRDTFPYQNIQLLTEFSLQSLLEQGIKYTYRYQDIDNPNYPGASSYQSTSNYVVERFIQERLDEVVSVKSYGAKGNGIDDDTSAIRNAIEDVSRDDINKYRMLYFPAGTYLISSSIYLRPKCTWVGDGIDKTKILLAPNLDDKGVTLDPVIDILPTNPAIMDMYSISGDGTGNFGDQAYFDLLFPSGLVAGSQIYYTGIINEEWKIISSAFTTVVETADGHNNTGLNIGYFETNPYNADNLPANISIRGITFERDTVGDIIRLNRASDVHFENCKFAATWDCDEFAPHMVFGEYFESSHYNQQRDGISIRIDSMSNLDSSILESKNFSFDNCQFYGNTYGFYITDSIENINVVSSNFDNMFKAITLGEGVLYSEDLGGELTIPPIYNDSTKFGPLGFKATMCTFSRIFDTPYSVYTSNPGNISAYNRYTTYGYGCRPEFDPKLNATYHGLPPNFDAPNPPRPTNTVWSTEVAPAVFFFGRNSNHVDYFEIVATPLVAVGEYSLSFPPTPEDDKDLRVTIDGLSANYSFNVNTGILTLYDINNNPFFPVGSVKVMVEIDQVETYDNMSIGDTFDYDGQVEDIRVHNMANYNAIMNTQDSFHLPYGVSLGDVTYLPMEHQVLELPVGMQDMRTGIILDTQEPMRANSAVIDYTLTRGIAMRKGQLHIVTDGLEINWWEQITDIGDELDVDFMVVSTESAKFRIKYNDIRYANPAAAVAAGDSDPIMLRWSARYWDHSFVGYGAYVAPFDGEQDAFGESGSDDWGLITEATDVPDEEYENLAIPGLEPPNPVKDDNYGILF